jgi:hypothetical protein
MTYSPKEKLQLNVDDVVWREVGDELVVLELSTSTYLTLNGAAKHLWEGLASGSTIGDLVQLLADRYRIADGQATADTESFLSALAERNLLVRSEE